MTLGVDSVEEETFPEDNEGKETLTLRRYLISQFNYKNFSFKNVSNAYEKEKIDKYFVFESILHLKLRFTLQTFVQAGETKKEFFAY